MSVITHHVLSGCGTHKFQYFHYFHVDYDVVISVTAIFNKNGIIFVNFVFFLCEVRGKC